MGRSNTAFKVRDRLIVEDSGSTIVDIQGSLGQLLAITDDFQGSLFSVNNSSGIPVLEALDNDIVKIGTFGNEAIIVNGDTASLTGSLEGTSSYASYALNANLLDNIDSSKFLRSDIDDETVGQLTVKNLITSQGNDKYSLFTRKALNPESATLYVQSSGSEPNTTVARFAYGSTDANAGYPVLVVKKDSTHFLNTKVGIGTTSPSEKLTVSGNISGTGTLDVTGNTTLGGTLTVDSTGSFKNEISSDTYELGFFGNGWRIGSDASAEFENLTVRGTFSVYELLIQQIRATNGSLLISNASKVASASIDSGDQLTGSLFFDTGSSYGHTFRENDIILAQRLNVEGGTLIQSFLQVSGSSDTGSLVYYKLHGTDPQPGFDYVRIGNTVNTDRQGHIYLTADDTNAPYIGVRDGLDEYTDFTTGTGSIEKVRVGKLSGLNSTAFGNLSGYGLWASGSVYLEGAINATTGSIAGWEISSNSIRKEEVISTSPTTVTKVAGMYFPENDNDIVFKAGQQSDNSTPAFTVRYNGQITGSQVNFIGGTIGGFNVSSNSIKSNDDTSLILTSDGQITGSKVLFDGGSIGGFVISSGSGGQFLSASGSNGTVYLRGDASGNQFFIKSPKFNVKANGDITGSSVDLSGKISATSGEIAGPLNMVTDQGKITVGGEQVIIEPGYNLNNITVDPISNPSSFINQSFNILLDFDDKFQYSSYTEDGILQYRYIDKSGTSNTLELDNNTLPFEVDLSIVSGSTWGTDIGSDTSDGLTYEAFFNIYIDTSTDQTNWRTVRSFNPTLSNGTTIGGSSISYSRLYKQLIPANGDSYVRVRYIAQFRAYPEFLGGNPDYRLSFNILDSSLNISENPKLTQYNPKTVIKEDGVFVRITPEVITQLTGDSITLLSQPSNPEPPTISAIDENDRSVSNTFSTDTTVSITPTNNGINQNIYYVTGSSTTLLTPDINDDYLYEGPFQIPILNLNENDSITVKAISINEGELSIPSVAISQTYRYKQYSPDVPYGSGWNLISNPYTEDIDLDLIVTDPPDAILRNTLFEFNGSYVASTVLQPGKGYWINFNQIAGIQFNSSNHQIKSDELEITLTQGWNIIGGIGVDAEIQDDNNIILEGTLYGFNGSYIPENTIEPGKGYWIAASEAGTIKIVPIQT